MIIRFDASGFRDIGGRLTRAKHAFWNQVVFGEMHRFGRIALQTLKQEAPGKRLPNKLSYEVRQLGRDNYVLEVGAKGYDPTILKYVVRGTRPHVIQATRARALRFYWVRVGSIVFFKRVFHPGTLANPFPQRTAISLYRTGELDKFAKRVGHQTVKLMVDK